MVDRYRCFGWDIRRGEMKPRDDGEWVRYSDYETLEAERDDGIATIKLMQFHNKKRSEHDGKLIEAAERKVATLEAINANLMGDDEDKPRYTTRRMKQEVARQTEVLRQELLVAEADKARLSEALRKIVEIDHIQANERIYGRCAQIALAALAGSNSGWRVVPNGEPVTLDDCPEGLFLFNGYLGFMTEYATDKNDGFRQRDAYCVDSGEYFWGGTSNARERAKLIVQPMLPAAPQQGAIRNDLDAIMNK